MPGRCANCGGKHEATSPKCPEIRETQKEAVRLAWERKNEAAISLEGSKAVVLPIVSSALQRQVDRAASTGTSAGSSNRGLESSELSPPMIFRIIANALEGLARHYADNPAAKKGRQTEASPRTGSPGMPNNS